MYRQKGNEHVFFLLNEKNKKDETTTKKTTQILNAKRKYTTNNMETPYQ